MKIKEKIKELEKQIEELKNQSQKEEEMKEWFKSLLNGLEIEIRDNRPDSVYYKKNGNVFFELYQGSKEKYLWVDYNLVWYAFNNKYNLNHVETHSFIKRMVEKHLKLSKVSPNWW
jgi:hypothetical protein